MATYVRLSTWRSSQIFLAMLHGSSGDSIQGTFKYLVANASLWSLKKPFDTPEKMFLQCKNNINSVWFLSASHLDVKNHASELKLG